jgi:hypothetical protein
VEDTVISARDHALQIIYLEEQLHIFVEPYIQQFVLQSPTIMHWINRIYSFIHIPGSIAFLIWLFYTTHTPASHSGDLLQFPEHEGIPREERRSLNPQLFRARRRTMALCNLLAFTIFTIYPCMPPRLLSSDETSGDAGDLARSYGFIDTVHSSTGESSVWTQNRFCNQYAAMPSLHFGYSLLIGLTIMTIPFARKESEAEKKVLSWRIPGFNSSIPKHTPRITVQVPSWKRLLCMALGVFYPSLILLAILATANHFILDAVAGAVVCGIAWVGNGILLNLLAVEDWFLWLVRIHKPDDSY